MNMYLAILAQTQLGERAFETIALLLFTYVPLQAAAIWLMKRPVWRIVAGLPLLPMLPVAISGAQPGTYRDGSLFGILLMAAYLPAMVYVGIFVIAGLIRRARDSVSTESSPVELKTPDPGEP